MKYLQNVGDVNESVQLSMPHKTAQVYYNKVSDDDDDDDNNGESTYGNVPTNDVTSRYIIPVTDLHYVINKKRTNDGFLKEYEVSVLYWFW